jgi:hypothetical protein
VTKEIEQIQKQMYDLEENILSPKEYIQYHRLLDYYPRYLSMYEPFGWYGMIYNYWSSAYVWDPFWSHPG